MVVAISSLLLATQAAYGHGEDKPGPNGGYIRMPGAYHTELVMTAPNRAKVYLLDMNWKNPVVKDSLVQFRLVVPGKMDDKAEVKPTPFADCKATNDHFICELPKSADFAKHGSLILKSVRAKQAGIAATYTLPLSFKPESSKSSVEPAKDEHHHHH